jgi:hypothetical protein
MADQLEAEILTRPLPSDLRASLNGLCQSLREIAILARPRPDVEPDVSRDVITIYPRSRRIVDIN